MTSYHPTAGTRVRQAGDEGQSGMKKTKEKPRKENALLRQLSNPEGQNIKEKS